MRTRCRILTIVTLVIALGNFLLWRANATQRQEYEEAEQQRQQQIEDTMRQTDANRQRAGELFSAAEKVLQGP